MIGHRALVGYECTDGQYTLYYSHWAAANLKLKHRISAESPFDGDDTDSKWEKQLLADLADCLEVEPVDGYLAGELVLVSIERVRDDLQEKSRLVRGT